MAPKLNTAVKAKTFALNRLEHAIAILKEARQMMANNVEGADAKMEIAQRNLKRSMDAYRKFPS